MEDPIVHDALRSSEIFRDQHVSGTEPGRVEIPLFLQATRWRTLDDVDSAGAIKRESTLIRPGAETNECPGCDFHTSSMPVA